MSDLFKTIKDLIEPAGQQPLGGWTSVPKAQTFAAVVLGLRPEVSVEIGVWFGRSSLSMALAHKEIGRGVVHAIDAWSPHASIEGQGEADVKHWAATNHEIAYNSFMQNIQRLELQNIIKIHRAKSQDTEPPKNIGFLVIDGNHGDTAISDVKRYAPNVRTGGLVYCDDLNWSTGSVLRAIAILQTMGFVRLYDIEQGAMFQRI